MTYLTKIWTRKAFKTEYILKELPLINSLKNGGSIHLQKYNIPSKKP